MVAGIVHLVAPTAKIMPLKAFHADGTSNLSDIIRAIYYAADHGVNVLSMSFSMQQVITGASGCHSIRPGQERGTRRGVWK